MAAYAVALLLILVASIYQFTQHLWGRAVLNLLLFLGGIPTTIVALILVVIAMSVGDAFKKEDSQELPLDDRAAAEIRRMSKRIEKETLKRLRGESFRSTELRIRSIAYVEAAKERYAEMAFCGSIPGCVEWHDITVFSDDGSLVIRKPRHSFTSTTIHESGFPEKMQATLDAVAARIVRLPEHAEAKPWPIVENVHAALKSETARLLALYTDEFERRLAAETEIQCILTKIAYEMHDSGHAEIHVSFRADGEGVNVSTGVQLDWKDGKFRFRGFDHPSWNEETAHIVDTSNSALDQCVARWLESAEPGSVLDGLSRTPEDWEEARGALPGGGTLVLMRRNAHPFLAEYDRKIRIELPSCDPEILFLPMNTGGRTNIRVFMVEHENGRFLRLRDHSHLNAVIRLSDRKLVPAGNYPEGRFIGAFMGVTTPLTYVDVARDRQAARKIFRAAKDRGYGEALNTLDGSQ